MHGDGVVAVDGGANIGVHTIEWATAMTGWGSVIAIEPQERIYYALAGTLWIIPIGLMFPWMYREPN